MPGTIIIITDPKGGGKAAEGEVEAKCGSTTISVYDRARDVIQAAERAGQDVEIQIQD